MKNKMSKELILTQKEPQDEATALISQAIAKNVSVESLERLLAMRKDLRAERAKEEFDKAMATFQAECPTIEKTRQGYNYKYADLTTIIEQVKELLANNGFSYTFDTDETENAVIIYCHVKHIAGHSETSKATIHRETTTKMNASQQSGAAMTYGKRYAFVNALGILTGDEDTDGASMNNHSEKQETQAGGYVKSRENVSEKQSGEYKREPVEETVEKMTFTQQKYIYKLLTEKKRTHEDLHAYLKAAFDKTSVTQLSKEEAARTITKLFSLSSTKQEIIDIDAVGDAIDREEN